MLPIKLTIQGLYAYKTKQTIDFRTLTKDHLFGIFGSVGSGKSSILDAISLALYDKIERVSKQTDALPYNIFNKASQEFLIDYEFESGSNPDLYRFVVKNGRKKTGEPKSFERAAYVWKSGDWSPLEKTDASHIFNLSYENFRRTVIIPQGKFSDFLQLTGGERTAMMIELFPKLGEFDFSQKVGFLISENKEKWSTINGQLMEIGLSDSGNLEEKKEEIKTASLALVERKQNLLSTENRFQELNVLKDLHEQFSTKSEIYKNLELNKPDYDLKKEKLEKYEFIFRTFDADFKLLDNAKTMFLESKEKLEQLEQKVKNQIENLDSEQKKSEVLNQEALFIPAWEIEISDLNLISESQKLASKKEETDLELSQISLALLKLNSDKELIKNELQGNKDNLEKLEASVQNYPELLNGLQFFKENARISEERKKIEDRIREVQLKIETLRAEKDETLKGLVFSRIPEINPNTRLKEVLVLLDSEKEKLNLEIGQMQDHILQLGKKEQLFQFTSQMVDGDPCPLCGSLHHPEIVTSEDVGSLVQSAQNQIKNLLALNSEIEKDYRKLHDLAASLSTEVEQLKTLNERLSASDASLENLKSEYSSNPYVSMGNQAVSDLFSKSEQQRKDILSIKNRVKDLEENFLRVENSLEPEVNKEKSLKQILAGIDGQILSFKNQVKSLNPDTILNLEETESKINILSKKLKTTKENLELQKARLDALKLDLVSAEATKKSLFELVEKYKTEEAKLSERVLQKIEKENLTNMEEVRKTLDSHFDSEKIKLEIEAFFKQLDLVVNDLKNLKDKIHHREFDAVLWEEAKESILNQKQNISALEGELAVLIEQVKDIEIRQAKLEKLQNEKAVLEKRRDNLSVLSSLFKGKDFVNFVSSVYLKNVVDVANERFFRLTRQKLMLVLDGDNNFYVKDFLNEGHERLAKTLSGGQIFQASLSLALALADTVRHKTKSEQNFFFLDEGFGSLDKESLHLVFDTLRQLKHENRIVGVISHIEEMQQEIDQCLKIRMDEEFGSIIEVK